MMRKVFLILLCLFAPLPSLAASQDVLYDTVFYAPAGTSSSAGGDNIPPELQNAPGNPTGNAALGQQMAAAKGWTGQEWNCLYQLWDNESSWNEHATNKSSGAYGIPQALPGDKMASSGSDWQTNAATQISWGLDYIAGRYKTPCNALSFWYSDKQPPLPPGHWY